MVRDIFFSGSVCCGSECPVPASKEALVRASASTFPVKFSAYTSEKASDDSSPWVPASHTEDMDGAPPHFIHVRNESDNRKAVFVLSHILSGTPAIKSSHFLKHIFFFQRIQSANFRHTSSTYNSVRFSLSCTTDDMLCSFTLNLTKRRKIKRTTKLTQLV